MSTLQYRLEKPEYLDWIRWEIQRKNSPKRDRRLLLLLLGAFTLAVGAEYLLFRDKPQLIQMSVFFGIVLVAGFGEMLSPKNKERLLWIKSGLDQVERKHLFPTIFLSLGDDTFTLSSNQSDLKQSCRYDLIREVVELEHIIMVMTPDGAWQFVSQKAFRNTDEKERVMRLFSCEKAT